MKGYAKPLIDVVHKHKPYHGNNLRKCTMPLDAS